MFRFSKPETPRAALFVFLRNETHAKSGFVSYVSISLCFDFDPTQDYLKFIKRRKTARYKSADVLHAVSPYLQRQLRSAVLENLVYIRICGLRSWRWLEPYSELKRRLSLLRFDECQCYCTGLQRHYQGLRFGDGSQKKRLRLQKATRSP